MSIPAQRRLTPKEVRRFGSGREVQPIPELTTIQTHGYHVFLQDDAPPEKRKKEQGLEAVLREIFPIESYDKTIRLDYVFYELG